MGKEGRADGRARGGEGQTPMSKNSGYGLAMFMYDFIRLQMKDRLHYYCLCHTCCEMPVYVTYVRSLCFERFSQEFSRYGVSF